MARIWYAEFITADRDCFKSCGRSKEAESLCESNLVETWRAMVISVCAQVEMDRVVQLEKVERKMENSRSSLTIQLPASDGVIGIRYHQSWQGLEAVRYSELFWCELYPVKYWSRLWQIRSPLRSLLSAQDVVPKLYRRAGIHFTVYWPNGLFSERHEVSYLSCWCEITVCIRWT